MTRCSDIGVGWGGTWGNCVYNPDTPAGLEETPFTGTYESLGFADLLPEDRPGETPWEDFFDPYDLTEEYMRSGSAAIDVRQLDKAFGLKRKEYGTEFSLGKGLLREKAEKGLSGADLVYSGTIQSKLESGLKEGETVYEQAMEGIKLKVAQGKTDIAQKLKEDIFGMQEKWKDRQRDTLDMILGMDVWGEDPEGIDIDVQQQQDDLIDLNIELVDPDILIGPTDDEEDLTGGLAVIPQTDMSTVMMDDFWGYFYQNTDYRPGEISWNPTSEQTAAIRSNFSSWYSQTFGVNPSAAIMNQYLGGG